MGKKRAAKIAIAKANESNNNILQKEINDLNQLTENLRTLLQRETDQRIALEAKLEEASVKTSTKKTSKKKTAVSEAETEKE